MADYTVKLTIKGDGTVAVAAIKDVEAAAAGMAGKAASAGNATAAGMRSISTSAAAATGEMSKARDAAAALYSRLALFGGLAIIAKTALSAVDAWSDMTSRVRVNIGASEDAAAIMGRLGSVARTTYSSLESTADSFARNAVTLGALGKSTQEQLDYTEALNNALVVSGAKGQAFEQVQDALSKAMATGALRGIELNTVLSSGSRVAQVLAQELGTNVIGLRALGEQGRITGDVIFNALTRNMRELSAEAESMPATIGDAFTLLRNSLLQTVGAFDQQNAISQTLASSLVTLADSMGTLVTVVIGMGVSLAAAHAAAAVGAKLQESAQRAVAASALKEAEAQVVKARAMTALGGPLAAITAAEARLAVAQEAAAVAGVARAGMFARLGSSLLALAGGPIGVAVIALGALGTAIYGVYQREQERIAQFDASIKAMQATTAAANDLADAYAKIQLTPFQPLPDFDKSIDSYIDNLATLKQKQGEYNAKRAELDNVEARIRAAMTATNDAAGVQLLTLAPRAQRLREELEALDPSVRALRESTDRLGDALGGVLAPGMAKVGRAAIDMANDISASRTAMASIQAASGVLGVSLTAIADAIRTGLAKSIREGNAANAELGAGIAAVEEKYKTFGLTQAKVLQKQLDAVRASIQYKNASDSERAALEASAAAAITHARAMEKGADSARKQAAKAAQDFIDSLDKQVATYGLAGTAADRYMLSTLKLSDAQRQYALDQLDLLDALEEMARADKARADALKTLEGISGDLGDALEQIRARASGASAAQIVYNRTLRDAAAAFRAAGGAANPAAVTAFNDAVRQAGEVLDSTRTIGRSLGEIIEDFAKPTQFDALRAEIERVGDALKKALEAGADESVLDPLRKALAGLKGDMRELTHATASDFLGATRTALQGVQSLAREGSREYAQMQVAIDAITLAESILAVVHQATSGDPYSAIPRMIAMAATLASLGQSISIAGGAGFRDTAAQRQASQGTGTVLGDATAKSESIAHAVEITANATQQLVGINRGMLAALQSLQQALGAAGGQIARGASSADFSDMNLAVGQSQFWTAFDVFGILGGKSKITDEGIVIFGGALSQLLENVAVGAYQEVQSRSWLFGSTHTREGIKDISDAFGKQFALVISSIADTVRAGAQALGLLPADIEAAMAAYQVAQTRISLKGLTAEEQQKELEAVFSSIFDGLAGAVVPFIEQFQQVGEGLGETLVRVATEVQVVQEAFRQFGMAVDQSDPERFAQISDALVQAVGGIDAFIEGLQSFTSHFADDAQQFRIAYTALTSAFEQAGLALPTTRDGMWALMQSLDATTEAGREQIATLLRLSATADQYFGLLEQAQSDMVKQIEAAIDTLSAFGVGVGEGGNKLRSINQSAIDAVNAANLLARASGQQGAAEWQLALIHRVAAARAAEAIAQLMAATQDLVQQFYAGGVTDATAQASSSVRDFGDAMGEAARQASDAIRLLLGDLSPLNDQAKLQVALDALARGEVGKEDVLQIGRRLYASSQAYTDLFNRVMAMRVPGTPGSSIGSGGVDSAINAAAITPEQRARERMDLAMQIGANVATLANAQDETFEAIAQMLGLNLADIGDALGLSNDDLQEYLQNLVDQENRTPDSVADAADRIIAALYDIAGGGSGSAPGSWTPPGSSDTGLGGPLGNFDIPQGAGGESSPITATVDDETAGALKQVAPLLQAVLDAIQRGDSDLTAAMHGVSQTLRDTDAENETRLGRRNLRMA